ncbi:MAG: hypothetical protein IKV94_01105 [Clostridia bacterium]|nr:hypothetical protein [Clostridia bacterium]
MNKGNNGLIILIVLLLITVITLCGAILYLELGTDKQIGQTSNGGDSTNDDLSSITHVNTPVKEIKKVDDTKDLVYLSYSKTTGSYSHYLPAVNIDSTYANSINEEITNIFSNNENYADYNLNYFSYLNDNILSLVVTSEINNYISYKVYNIDVYTGNKVENTDIIGTKNVSENTYLENLKTASKNAFIQKYPSEMSEDAWYIQMLNKTEASENNTIDLPVYLDENGDIWTIVKIYSLAGPESFNVAVKVM